MRRVLTDYTGTTQLQVVEGQDGGKLVVEGKIGQCDVPTANGRVYPRPIIEREINRLKPRVEQSSVMSAVDHPGDGKTRIKDSGAIVRGLWVEDNGEIHGRFEIVEEASAGKDLAAFLRRGAQVGMSSRGMGSTIPGPSGHDVVGEDYKLSTWDFVSDPACKDAYPALMSEDEEHPVTEDYLRAHFPEIIRSIEERAHLTAQQIVEEDITERVTKRVEADAETALVEAKDALRDGVKIEVHEEVFQLLRDDFAVRLVRALAEMREDITEEVRSDLASDPAVAGAKATLKKVAEMVSTFKPAGGAVLHEKDEKTVGLEADLNYVKEELAKAKARTEDLEKKARLMAYQLYIEQTIGGRADKEAVRGMIGVLEGISGAEDLKQRVESACAKADAVQAESEAKVEETQNAAAERVVLAEERAAKAEVEAKRLGASEERIKALVEQRVGKVEESVTAILTAKDAELEAMQEQLATAVNQGAQAALMAYAYERTIGHPKARDIVEEIRVGNVTTKDQIDRIATRLEEGAQESGGVRERVRRALSFGREHMTEDERVEAEGTGGAMLREETGDGEANDDLQALGTNLKEQLNLSRGPRRTR